MVNPLLIIVAAAFVGIIFIRKELGETGAALGSLGVGLGTGLSSVGRGIQTFVSSILSPQIRPALVPTLGLKLELPFGIGGNNSFGFPRAPAAVDDRQGGRNVNVGSIGREGLPPTSTSDVRSGGRPDDLRERQLRGGFFT